MNPQCILYKLRVARSVFKNWPMVFLDRLGLINEILYHTRLGPVMHCRGGETDSGTVAVIFSGKEYPLEVIQFDLFRDNPFIWDLGANIGTFSVWAASHLNAELSLICVEPHDGNLIYLQRNLKSNNIRNVKIFDGVVDRESGYANLDINRKADAIRVSSETTGARVKAITLEDLAKLENIDRVDLLKMDIEGSEYAVLESSLDFVSNYVDRLIVEIHGRGKGHENYLVPLLEKNFDTTIVSENVLFFKSKRVIV